MENVSNTNDIMSHYTLKTHIMYTNAFCQLEQKIYDNISNDFYSENSVLSDNSLVNN